MTKTLTTLATILLTTLALAQVPAQVTQDVLETIAFTNGVLTPCPEVDTTASPQAINYCVDTRTPGYAPNYLRGFATYKLTPYNGYTTYQPWTLTNYGWETILIHRTPTVTTAILITLMSDGDGLLYLVGPLN